MKSYTAKTLEELLKGVAQEKNVEVAELTYFVTDEKKGLFGLGGSISAEVYCLNDVKEFIFEYLGSFFTNLDLETEVEIVQDNDTFKVLLNASNNAILIGKNGQTLQAINTVVKNAANSIFKRRFQIMVDINNYKEKRYEKLTAMAKRIAKTVQRTKVSATLDPMPNDERKIIHQALTNYTNIKTESEGDGKTRHLKIIYSEEK